MVDFSLTSNSITTFYASVLIFCRNRITELRYLPVCPFHGSLQPETHISYSDCHKHIYIFCIKHLYLISLKIGYDV